MKTVGTYFMDDGKVRKLCSSGAISFQITWKQNTWKRSFMMNNNILSREFVKILI